MSDRQLDPYHVLNRLRAEAELLRRANPEMNEDEKLYCDMIEGATDLPEFIHDHVKKYFENLAIATALYERAETWERRALGHKEWVKQGRAIGHITEKQTFPEATVFESRKPDELIFNPDNVPREYLTVAKIPLRKAVKDGLIREDIAKLVPSNEPPTLVIKVK